jgi:hypothetical protein
MSSNKIKDILFTEKPNEYSDEKFQDHLLEQYKLYIEMTDRISQRRQSANTWFLTINTALLTAIGAFLTKEAAANVITTDISIAVLLVISFAGGLNCLLWWRLIVSYKQMNSGKFSVIHEIENKLPLKIYDAEWEALGRGEDSSLYQPFTHIEQLVPLVFGLLYLSLIIIMCFKIWG